METTEEVTVPKLVRPDERHRVLLGAITAGVSSYNVELKEHGVIVLIPNVEIPAEEAWLWRNKAALASVRRGIEQLERGERGKSLGSFAKYAK